MSEPRAISDVPFSITQELRVRAPIIGVTLMVIAFGLLARYGLSGWASKYVGLGLWATMIYALVVLARPSISPLIGAAVALAFCWMIEFMQLTPGPAWLSSQPILLRLIFGIGFSAWDLPTYAAGVGLGAGVHVWGKRASKGEAD